MSVSHPYISVIVPVYNGSKFIGRCLDALMSSTYSSYEILVVNDGSTDDTEAICKAKGVMLMQSERPRSGPAAVRNFASLHTRGEILMFVDADVVAASDAIEKVAACFEGDPKLSAVFGSYDDSPDERNFLSQYKNLQHHFVHQNSSREASTFWAGLGAVRADVFRSIGRFDEVQFAIPSIEDIELGTRLRRAGHPILLDATLQGKHLKRWDVGSLLRTDIFCRAVPWSRLILTSQGLVNDMNLKTNDRACAALVAVMILLVPLSIWQPLTLLGVLMALVLFVYLNRSIFLFFVKNKGWLFAAMTLPWQLLYFLYSGTVFVACWIIYALPAAIGSLRREIS